MVEGSLFCDMFADSCYVFADPAIVESSIAYVNSCGMHPIFFFQFNKNNEINKINWRVIGYLKR